MEMMTVADEPRFWELYRLWCEDSGVDPTIKGFVLWVQEYYDGVL